MDQRSVRPGQHGGFTLIELLVVVAIIATIGQIVLANIGALVPSTVLDSDAQKLMSEIEYLRSEAQLQGKSLQLEIDLDHARYRRILPAEMRVTFDQDPEELEAAMLGWNELDSRCRFAGYEVLGSPAVRDGRVRIVLDHNGFTSDQSIYVAMKSEDLAGMVWTIQLRGLDRRANLIKDIDGLEAAPTLTGEQEF